MSVVTLVKIIVFLAKVFVFMSVKIDVLA